jgi:hypothetical protein
LLKTFSITDIGKKRKLNQDYVFSSDTRIGNLSNVFIVADGMGGHNAGDYASRFTVDTMVEEIEKQGLTGKVAVIEGGCTGTCAVGPVVSVFPEKTYYTEMTPEKVRQVVK